MAIKHPAELAGAKSLNADIKTNLKVTNTSEETLKVYWLNYDGKREFYATLKPGESFNSDTFVTHPWLVTDAKEKAWALFYPDAQARVVDVAKPLVKAVAFPAITPTKEYTKRTIEGFEVLIHPDVLKNEKEAKEAQDELAAQLKTIQQLLDEKHVKPLRKVKFWMEWTSRTASAAQYHVSPAWLKDNGYNPDKAGCVDINDVRNFLRTSRSTQPFMILHELAHAYHFRVLGEKHDGILAAYRQAMDRKLYDSVAHVNGKKQRAYAATNEKEYFAELTEAYFGKNDFFPFNRAELEKHDPVGYQLMRDIWGEPKDADKR
jgi:hypothetical protein